MFTTTDLVPGPRWQLREPPGPASLLAELDPGLVARFAAWSEAIDTYTAARDAYYAVLSPNLAGTQGIELGAAQRRLRHAVAEGGRGLDELGKELANLLEDRPRRLARCHAAAEIADCLAAEVMSAAKGVRPAVADREHRLEGELVGILAPFGPGGDDPDREVALATVRARRRSELLALARLDWWLANPQKGAPGEVRFETLDGRLAELNGDRPASPWVDRLIVEDGSTTGGPTRRAYEELGLLARH